MSLTTETKKKIIDKYAQSDRDTASPQVQIAMLSERLKTLNEHFKDNHKDHHSRQGLLRLVGRRKKLMRYLNRKDPAAYEKLITSLGIRG